MMSMENIHYKISDSLLSFEQATGIKPTKIYLGRNDCLALEEWAKHTFAATSRTHFMRREFLGRDVFVVDADNHIAVSV